MNCCIKGVDHSSFSDGKPACPLPQHACPVSLNRKIPRPPNAFMLYANDNRKTMAQMFPADSNKEISKRLGQGWKNLEPVEKNHYFQRAKDIDIEHKRKYPDYVYNPKEARLRKAMRDAMRDRSIGASPMLPRPGARGISAGHGWPLSPTPRHDDLIMSGMRSPMDSSACFPISGGTGSQFMQPPPMEAPLPPPHPSNNTLHTDFMQPNPLAQLQQQTEMWHNYPDMNPRANHYMLQEPLPRYHHQSSSRDIQTPIMVDKQSCQQASTVLTLTPPPSNENVPPDDLIKNDLIKNVPSMGEISFDKPLMETTQPLVETNNIQQDDYMVLYDEQGILRQSKDGGKTRKPSSLGTPQNQTIQKKRCSKPLPDFNEAFGSTERGRFQSPPDPRLAPLDFFFDESNQVKFEDFQL